MDRLVMALTHVIAYDISEDNRRARAAAVLQSYGDRIQKSVFIATLDNGVLEEIRDRLADIVNPRTDSVYVFRQCEACWSTVKVLGQASLAQTALYWAVL
jgi:CRISPR-associated protein Cas2